eukprot:8877225-Prorocentrum_lima.AAC.1
MQQSIEAVATELIRVTFITATSLQRLVQYGENHNRFVETALSTWTASVEAQLREQAPKARQEQAAES